MATRIKRFYITYLFILVNVIITLFIFLVDKDFSVYTLIEFGAKYNPLIAAGEYYRLFTTMFLHGDIIHLLVNMYALKILGVNIEILYGRVKFVIIYILSGLFGTLGSFIFSNAVSVGASGAIFGLFGGYLYLYISHREFFSKSQLFSLFRVIGVNLLIGLIVPNIDTLAHVWGLVGGFITSWAIGLKGEKSLSKNKILAQILTVILLFTSFGAGIKINQDTWQYNLFKGIAYLKENNINDAQIQFEKGIEKNDGVEDFYYYLGHIYYIKNRRQESIEYFSKALELNPNFIEAEEMLKKLMENKNNGD